MLDRFVRGHVTRISPEAPVPIVRLDREEACLGGAGNVVRNIVALGGRALLVGLRGGDPDGEAVAAACRAAGVSDDGLVVDPDRPTTVKTRIIAHHQQVVRVDREEDGPVAPRVAGALRAAARDRLERAQALIVSDYDKGAVDAGLLADLLPAAARRNLPVVVDPKPRNFLRYRPATVVTPNAREAMEAAGGAARTDAELESAGRLLLERLAIPHLLITRGERGMLLLSRDGAATAIPAQAREVFDVAGAGDTVVATLALALAAGGSMPEGAALANLAAGVVVGKLGTAALGAAELLEAAGGRPRT
jgi:D-beta-D-heptose 7-phosphate kinase/D-beta-D-heptose 1-phosphate adenosyltransferase